MFDGLTSREVRDKFTLLARISLVFWATELDTSLSRLICKLALMNKSTSGNRAQYGFIEIDMINRQ